MNRSKNWFQTKTFRGLSPETLRRIRVQKGYSNVIKNILKNYNTSFLSFCDVLTFRIEWFPRFSNSHFTSHGFTGKSPFTVDLVDNEDTTEVFRNPSGPVGPRVRKHTHRCLSSRVYHNLLRNDKQLQGDLWSLICFVKFRIYETTSFLCVRTQLISQSVVQ